MWQLALPQDWSATTLSLAADTENAALYLAALGDRCEIISHLSDEPAAADCQAALQALFVHTVSHGACTVVQPCSAGSAMTGAHQHNSPVRQGLCHVQREEA